MKKREFLVIGAVAVAAPVLMAGCTTTGGAAGDPAEQRRAIDAETDAALTRLYREAPGSKELIDRSQGVLVLPRVVSGGFIFGAAGGSGALRVGGKTASYWRMAEGQVGLLAGAQSQAMFVVFMTQQALSNFTKGSGWTAGVDGNITLINVGANANLTTQTAQQPIVGFVLTNAGLMGGLSFQGTRFTRLAI